MTERPTHRHVEVDALVAGLLDGQSDETRAVELGACDLCRARAAEVAGWLATMGSVADEEADAAFPPERLAQQRARILRRLAELAGEGRPARVLTFPIRDVAVARLPRWSPRRLVATAAAVGLMAGLTAGSLFDLTSRSPSRTMEVAAVTSYSVETVAELGAVPSEEAFLLEIESALAGPGVEELRALDALTPSVLEAFMIMP